MTYEIFNTNTAEVIATASTEAEALAIATAAGHFFDYDEVKAEPVITHYTVFNRVTGKTTEYKTSAAASRACDRMDNAYGAVCCTRRAHWSDAA